MAFKDYGTAERGYVPGDMQLRVREAVAARAEIVEAIAMADRLPSNALWNEDVGVYITRLRNREIQLSRFISEAERFTQGMR